MGSKKYFNAVFLSQHDPSVIMVIHVLCVMFHCSIDNTRKGIGNGNEIMYFSRALPVLSFRSALLAGNSDGHYKRSCPWDFCGCYR